MDVSYRRTVDLAASAAITDQNMRPYYQHYSVDWALAKIQEQILGLENWDMMQHGTVVGAIRLAFDGQECYIRDLQVRARFQNQGLGAAALAECERLAIQAGMSTIRLRVFKISPAYRLYKRCGFVLDNSDDRFYYLSRNIV